MKVRQLCQLLEENGWVYAKTKGDHRHFIKPGARRPIIVAGHPGDDVPIGTLKSILKEAGL